MAKFFHLISITLFFILGGCASVPSSAADTGLSAGIYHVIPFQVSPGLNARVYIQETVVMVQVGNGVPQLLESIYPPLYQGWGASYLKTGDYDHDGRTDLAVLQSVGHGGFPRCYSIYRYSENIAAFLPRRSFDLCGI